MSKVWITRDDNISGTISFWSSDRSLGVSDTTKEWVSNSGAYIEIKNGYRTLNRFKRMFGFTPRKGSIGQYELSLKEIK